MGIITPTNTMLKDDVALIVATYMMTDNSYKLITLWTTNNIVRDERRTWTDSLIHNNNSIVNMKEILSAGRVDPSLLSTLVRKVLRRDA